MIVTSDRDRVFRKVGTCSLPLLSLDYHEVMATLRKRKKPVQNDVLEPADAKPPPGPTEQPCAFTPAALAVRVHCARGGHAEAMSAQRPRGLDGGG